MKLLGIDIGGSGIKAALVNSETGKLLSERYRVPTPKPSHPDAVAKRIKKVLEHFEWTGPVGVSFPTVIKNGMCIATGNISKEWKLRRVDQLFESYCNTKFYIINDADAAAEAEMKFGAGKGQNGLVVTITVGTGLGSGVFFNGELIPNFELGTIYGKDGKRIELYAADSARKREDLSYTKWGKRFNFFLNYISRTIHPDLIIIGGGTSKKLDRFEDCLDVDVPIVAAVKQNNAGIIGAAMFAYDNIKSKSKVRSN